jgi:hypothetical protein
MSRSLSKNGLYSDSFGRASALSKTATVLRRGVPVPERSVLAKCRVIQRDLVYVIGIPVNVAKEEVLARYEYFGQYGPIKKIVVNTQSVHMSQLQKQTVSAYITFVNIEDAWECLYALESFCLDGHALKASFGTSKYCSAFLSGQRCNKPDCMYLHEQGQDKDSFTTEEIQTSSQRFINMTRPTRPDDYDDYLKQDSKVTVFPPRRSFADGTLRKLPDDRDNSTSSEHSVLKHSFVADLLYNSGPLMHRPLFVDYSIGESLNDQFGLSKPTIRMVLKNNTR